MEDLQEGRRVDLKARHQPLECSLPLKKYTDLLAQEKRKLDSEKPASFLSFVPNSLLRRRPQIICSSTRNRPNPNLSIRASASAPNRPRLHVVRSGQGLTPVVDSPAEGAELGGAAFPCTPFTVKAQGLKTIRFSGRSKQSRSEKTKSPNVAVRDGL
ncbi:Cna protein B-type domain protein [Striga asiatica]|uniref:Cna protein B-type domain protein n=1 Tax=Striga asiatica TaxID=4170 RepID=A0A5A7PYK9_STRAF|nr:Cna protein B-type domain protein [Striga asiatica]